MATAASRALLAVADWRADHRTFVVGAPVSFEFTKKYEGTHAASVAAKKAARFR